MPIEKMAVFVSTDVGVQLRELTFTSESEIEGEGERAEKRSEGRASACAPCGSVRLLNVILALSSS